MDKNESALVEAGEPVPKMVPSGDSDGPVADLRQGPPRVGQSAHPSLRRVVVWASRYQMAWILVLVFIGASIAYSGFLSWGNLRDMVSQNAAVGIVAVGMTFVILTGGFDLSVGAVYGLGSVVYASMIGHFAVGPAILIVIAAGFVVGIVNGLVITRLRVNPFVATLGTASVFTGVAMIYSNSQTTLITSGSFSSIGSGSWLGIPVPICLFLIAAVVGGVILGKSVYGRFVYAVGGSSEASRLAGLRVDAIRTSVYAIAGACAALGGIVAAAQVGTAEATLGSTVPLSAIAVVVIGGTSLLGGEGAMWKTVVGLLIVGIINNVLESLAVATSVQSLVQGGILVFAVALDALGRRAR